MTYITSRKEGVSAIDGVAPYVNFFAITDGIARFAPSESSNVIGEFQNTLHPGESGNVKWHTAKCRLKKKADVATSGVSIITQLYGIMHDGSEKLLHEDIDQTISTTEETREIIFDLSSSSSTPELSQYGVGGALSGKAYVKLPKRFKNYSEIKLKIPWMEGWSKCAPINLIGSTQEIKYASECRYQVYIKYRVGMRTDFGDVRFIAPDGRTFMCYDTLEKVNGDYAIFNIWIDIVPGYPNTTPILMFYGKADATMKRAPNMAYHQAHNFDGITNLASAGWIQDGGTMSLDTSTPISGSKSLKHTGNGSDNNGNFVKRAHTFQGTPITDMAVEFDFDWKITNQGSASDSPYMFLISPFYKDSGNYVRFDTYYDTGTGKQRVRYVILAGGSATGVEAFDWLSGKAPAGTTYHIKARFGHDGTNLCVELYINGTRYMNIKNGAYSTGGHTHEYFAFGANKDGACDIDNLKIRYIHKEYPKIGYADPVISDTFPGTALDSTKWVEVKNGTSGVTTVSGNQVLMQPQNSQRYKIRTKDKLLPPYCVTFEAKRVENVEVNWGWNGVMSSSSPTPMQFGYVAGWSGWSSPTKWWAQEQREYNDQPAVSYNASLDTNWHSYTLRVDPYWAYLYKDGVLILTCRSTYDWGYFALSIRETGGGCYYRNVKIFDSAGANLNNVAVSPDGTPDPETQMLTFSRPNGSNPPIPGYLYVNEHTDEGVTTNNVLVMNNGQYRLGTDGIDRYKALKFKIKVVGNGNCNIEFSDFTYEYEVVS